MTLPFLNGPVEELTAAQARPATGPVTSFTENVSSSWDAMMATEMTWSENANITDVYEQNFERYRELTGQDLPAPRPANRQETRHGGTLQVYQRQMETLRPLIEQLIAEQPELAEQFQLNEDAVRETARQNALTALEHNEDVARRGDTSGGAGQLVGSFGSVFAEPTMWLTLPFGGPVGQGITGLGAFALREAGLAMVGEAAAQPQVQSYREELGLEAGFMEGLERVALTGVFGGGFGLFFGGAAQGFRGLMNRMRDTGELPPVSNRAIDEMNIRADEANANPSLLGGEFADHNAAIRQAVQDVVEGYMPEGRQTFSFAAREDLLGGTAFTRVAETDLTPDIDLTGVPEVATAIRRHADIQRSEQALRELDELQARVSQEDLRYVDQLRVAETEIQNLTRELLSVNSDLAARAGRGRKAAARVVMREIDPNFMARLNSLENRKTTLGRQLSDLDEPRIKRSHAKAEDISTRIDEIETLVADPKLPARKRRKLINEQDALINQRRELVTELSATDSPDMARIRSQLIETDAKLRAMAEKQTALRKAAEEQLSMSDEALAGRQTDLEAQIANVHNKRHGLVKKLELGQKPTARSELPPGAASLTRSGLGETATGVRERPPVRPGTARREAAANVEYERLVSETNDLNRIRDNEWATAEATLKENPEKTWLFDDVDDLGDLRARSMSGQRVLDEIGDMETLLREFDACIAGPGNVA